MHRRRWRFYETASGAKPVQAFLDKLTIAEAAEVGGAMKEVAVEGLRLARHLRGDIWEVRVEAERKAFRVLFSPEGKAQQVLLALKAFTKNPEDPGSHPRARRAPPIGLAKPGKGNGALTRIAISK